MKKIFDEIALECELDCNVKYDKNKDIMGAMVHTFTIDWDYTKVTDKTILHFSIKKNSIGHMFSWDPDCDTNRKVSVGWVAGKKSMISISAPVVSIYDAMGRNRFTCALSEVKESVSLRAATVQDRYFGADIKIALNQFHSCGHFELKIYIDETDVAMYKALDNVRLWWEEGCGLKPMPAPDCAKDVLYSSWYSFQQGLYQDKVMAEMERAAELGFKNVILDDGWVADGVETRFAYCGDWEFAKEKFYDFNAVVDRIHELGMKVMLWMGIPYVGEKSKLWNIFNDKVLQYSDYARASILDPRYPDVREHIISCIIRIMKDYNLDGLKLDFIDLFYEVKDSKISDEMDYLSVPEATDRLMVDIKNELVAIKPDVMIEFRQKYTGPNMRKYGNMFRVSDCPNDYMANKLGVIDLRLLMGESAVHSDMLIWNEEEETEIAALQIINIIFSTMQFSVPLNTISDEHKKMLGFWMKFMAKHKELLQNAPIIVEEPQLGYTLAKTEKNNESIIAVYSNNKCVCLNENIEKTIVLNGSGSDRIVVEVKKAGVYRCRIQNCLGEELMNKSLVLKEGIISLEVPVSGIVSLKY